MSNEQTSVIDAEVEASGLEAQVSGLFEGPPGEPRGSGREGSEDPGRGWSVGSDARSEDEEGGVNEIVDLTTSSPNDGSGHSHAISGVGTVATNIPQTIERVGPGSRLHVGLGS